MGRQQNIPGNAVSIVLNITDETGAHVATVIDTTTTRLSTHPAAVPTVDDLGLGKVKINFAGLNPVVNDGDEIYCTVNGTADAVAWSPWLELISIRGAQGPALTVITDELDKVIKSGEQANYVSDLGSKAVTATRV